jgi:short-subunit dehydrogenase
MIPRNTTIVITGASSGIGRATAELLAAPGVKLVLAARRRSALDAVASECRRFGALTRVVPTDVTDAEAVRELAEAAASFGDGEIDVWINNAGIGAVGEFDRTPVTAHDQVVQVNLLGYLHGAHAVLPYFKQQGTGILINVVSFGAWSPAPYAVSYSASKYGLRGYSEALRAELSHYTGIRICDVFPSVIDTPGFAHGANYTGKKLKAPKPVYDPRRVASAIARAIADPTCTRMTVGSVATAARFANGLLPALTRRITSALFEYYFGRAAPAPITDGTLFASTAPDSPIDGGWRSAGGMSRTAAAVGVVAALGVLGALWYAQRQDD